MRLADLVGMVSHRPFPGLPGKVGMARETRALPEGGQRGPGGSLMQIRARRVVCSPPRLASAVSRCRVCVVKFWQFASGWGSKKGQGLVVRSRLSW